MNKRVRVGLCHLIFVNFLCLACGVAAKSGGKEAPLEKSESASEEKVSEDKTSRDASASKLRDKEKSPRGTPGELNGGKPTPKDKAISRVKETLKRYRGSSAVQMKVKKRSYSELLEKESLYEGQVLLSKGKMRLDFEKPEKSMFLMDGLNIWLVNEFEGEEQIAKMAASRSTKNEKSRSNSLLQLFFDDEALWDQYEVASAKTEKGLTTYTLTALSGKTPEVNKIQISLARDAREVKRLAYWDELENEISFEFSDIKFGVNVPKSKFIYKPPKGADITEY